MLHYKDLHNLFFESFPKKANKFIALSGFVGPDPIKDLGPLDLQSTVIFGLFNKTRKRVLHQQLLNLHEVTNIEIKYPNISSHSKCYLWLKNDKPIKGFIGSANFSLNGLKNDYRETLFEVNRRKLYLLNSYMKIILESSYACSEAVIVDREVPEEDYDKEICNMVLYDPQTGETQPRHGLNWGFADANVRPNDACIPIRADHIKKYPTLFPPLRSDPENEGETLKEIIEIIWDNGVVVPGRFEGSQTIDRRTYPKQIATYPHKDTMGKYFRDRMGIEHGTIVTKGNLDTYGRDQVNVSLIAEGVYHIDFSPE
jgi:hypothetical protein